MRERLVTLLGALGALAVVYLLFLHRPSAAPVSRPLSVEAGRNGYLAVASWLKGQGVPVVSWRQRFSALEDAREFPGTGNILVSTMPYQTPLRSDEFLALRKWIDAGNTVLVLAALDDTPEWSSAVAGVYFMRDLAWVTGLTFGVYRGESADAPQGDGGDAAADDDPTPTAGADPAPADDDTGGAVGRNSAGKSLVDAQTAVELEPVAAHPLLDRVDSLHGFSDARSELWQAANPTPGRLVLRLAAEGSHGVDALWQLPSERGQVLLSASGTWLTNRNVAEGGARDFVANLLAYHLGSGGAVIFDDMHQGLSVLYDAAALVRDPRLTQTVYFLLAAWLVYLLGAASRLAPPARAVKVPRQADFLAAAGGFMARRLDRRAAALLLFDEWFAEVRRRRGKEGTTPPWAEIEATPTLGRSLYRELRESFERLQSGRAVDLVRLHNTLRAAREAIG